MVHQDTGAQGDQVDLVNLVNLVNLDPGVRVHLVTLVRLVHLVHLEPGPRSTGSMRIYAFGGVHTLLATISVDGSWLFMLTNDKTFGGVTRY